MDDSRRQQIIDIQRSTMQLGTVHFEAGLEISTVRGFIGTRYMSSGQTIFGPRGYGAITVVVVPDRDVLIQDQASTEVPFNRVLKIEFEPFIP